MTEQGLLDRLLGLYEEERALYAQVLQLSMEQGEAIGGARFKVEEKDAMSLMRLINFMDDLDDVAQVSANFEMDDDVMARVEEKL